MMNLNDNSHNTISKKLIQLLNQAVIPCQRDDIQFCEKISELIGNARIVLMGEATHGTMDFYQARMAVTKYLIREKGFQAIAIEGDWTSVYPVNLYCQGYTDPENLQTPLEEFKRFPTWMWRNTNMLDFVEKIREYNFQVKTQTKKVAFYGLDLYCLHEAAQGVIDYLQEHDPEAAREAIQRYACFDHMGLDPQRYNYLIKNRLKKPCVKEVMLQFLETQRLIYQNLASDLDEIDLQFYALQNARIVRNAENYYHSLFEPHYVTWNIRDQHMVDTLQNIMSHLESITHVPAKVIIWAHNTHIGDARATEMSDRQEINLGQLVRERFNTSSFLLGFSTSEGTVTAASEWGGSIYHKKIQLPIHGSYEWFFHKLKEKNFILNLRENTPLMHLLKSPQLQRAIGVIYHPETERISHYFFSHLPNQFDALVHFDKTQALIPLDKKWELQEAELPDTYPEGF